MEGKMLKGFRWVFVASIIISLLSSVEAQNQHPNHTRGFNSNGVYSSFDIDHINTFNGNLVITIPIGQNYPVNANLSYSLRLVYNSNVWSPREVCPDTVDQTQISSSFLSVIDRVIGHASDGSAVIHSEGTHVPGNDSGDIYLPLPPRVNPDECWTIQDPNPAANGGLGWQLSMGKLYEPRVDVFDDRAQYTEKSEWVYMSPDGSEHTFYRKLHNDDPDTGSTFIWYTRDGSYLRLNQNPLPNGYGNMLLEFPDGQKHYFTPVTIRLASGNQVGEIVEEKLSRIEDQFGNYINVQYLDMDGDGLKDDKWVISDSIGRTQTVIFARQSAGYPKSVNHVALEAFGAQTAHYTFEYAPTTITRPVPHVPPGYVSGYDDNVNVAFLTAINLPDGSKYSMPVDSSYFFPTGDHYSPGMLQKVVLPTGGNIQWKYESEDPQGDLTAGVGYYFGVASSARHYMRSAIGVRRRILTEGSNTYTWQYDPKLGSLMPTGCATATAPHSCSPAEFVNTVTTPQGDHTRYYFSVWPFPYDSGGPDALRRGLSDPHSADYGLPFTKDPRQGNHDPLKTYTDTTGRPLFLSEAIYDAGWNLKRSIYVRYETDSIDAGDGFGSMRDDNSRVSASRTVYDDDNGTYAEVQYTEFDGLGHYRRATTSGNFGAGNSRTEVTTYNRDADGTYHIYNVDPTTNQPGSGHNYIAFNQIRPWLLNLYDSKISSDFTQRSTTYFQFDGKGALTAKRTRKDFEPSSTTYFLGANDVLVQYNYDVFGNVVGESYFGGDRPGHLNLDTANVFPALNDSNSEYKLNYGHQCVKANGTPGTISVVSNTTYRGVSFKSTDDTIDCRTGQVKSSRDTAGVQTAYDYSDMGRLRYITRQQGNYEQIEYQPFTGGTALPRVTVTQLDRNNPNPNSGALGQQVYIYDQLGRLITERRLLPGGVYQVRNTTYNGLGWITNVTEWNDGATNAGRKTAYSNFDAFGRATKITLPDNKVVFIGFQGVRQITRTVNIGTQIDTGGNVFEQSSLTKEIYDRQGRLIQVQEPSGPAGQNTTWNYYYNVNNQLSGASASDPSNNAVGQNRSFGYDNLGNLVGQSLPERPWSQFFEYDTMGNLGKSYDGTHWLSYSYDSASRPTSVNELVEATSTWRPLKQFSYYAANDGTGGAFALGKLASSMRHNYVLNPYEVNQNMALASNGATAVASSTNSSGYDARYAIDGRRSGSQWGVNGGWNDGTANAWPDWVEVRFSGSKSISQVNVFSVQDNFSNPTEPTPQQTFSLYGLVDFQVQYWNGSSWVTVPNGSVVGNNMVWKQIGFAPVTTDRIRVYVTKALNTWTRIAEIEAIGTNPTIYDVGVQAQYTYSGVDGRMSKRATSTNIPNGPSFEQSFAYDQLGNLAWQTYPKCVNAECVQSGAQRPWTASYGYTNGALTSVGGGAGEVNTAAGTYATSITYNINGTAASVSHRNNVVDHMAMDPNYMQRPRQITSTLGASTIFDTGIFSYDGASNATRIGNDWYLYDKVSRLKEGTALLAGDPLKRLKQQYDYDTFGNRLVTRTYNNVSLTNATLKDSYASNVNTATNRLALSYDNAGNVLGLQNGAPTYTYDAFNMIVTAPGLTYLYGPGEERFWIIDTKQNNVNSDNEDTFTLRGLGNEVLREYKTVGGNAVGNWFWQKDYIYRGGTLLTAETNTNGAMHYHVDHLGSPRLVTDANGTAWERLQFLPFGENSGYYQNNEPWSLSYVGPITPTRLRFTGHEKDSDVLSLDYMHARHFWERNGRFMSVDPGKDWDPKLPQSWNMYSYVRNNPMNAVDPTGAFGSNIAAAGLSISSAFNDSLSSQQTRDAWVAGLQFGMQYKVPPDTPIDYSLVMKDAVNEVVRRLATIPTCQYFFNDGNVKNALVNDLAMINKTSYYFRNLGAATMNGVTGAGTLPDHKTVLINAQGPFISQQQMVSVPGGRRMETFDFGTGLRGVQFQALILLHELGHQTGVFRLHDASLPQLNLFYTRSVMEMCFPEVKRP
jgi:RHS repeat-associated protein